jgi:hypothetical protein
VGRWAFMLGGLIVWALHFFGVYTLASLGDVVGAADAPAWRTAVAGFSFLCLVATLTLLAHAVRALRRASDGEPTRFGPQLAMGSAGLGAVGVLWQALPAWIGH